MRITLPQLRKAPTSLHREPGLSFWIGTSALREAIQAARSPITHAAFYGPDSNFPPGVRCYNIPGMHAKVYLCEDERTLILSSQNAPRSRMIEFALVLRSASMWKFTLSYLTRWCVERRPAR